MGKKTFKYSARKLSWRYLLATFILEQVCQLACDLVFPKKKKKKKKLILSVIVQSLKLLSIMAAIRLEDRPDNIERLLVSSLHEKTTGPLTSKTWEEVFIRSNDVLNFLSI